MCDTLPSPLNRMPSTWARLVAWSVALAVIASLGWLRTSTDAEYAFASASIIPVLALAWLHGQRDGLALALLAALMWAGADLLAEREFSSPWIPLVNGITRFATYGLVAYLIARVKELLDTEKSLATHDSLTGLLNRRAFFAAGGDEAGRSLRYGHPLAILFLDLDDFKQLNDTRGHEAGDLALKAVAAALRGSLRASDRVARIGGDEFAVLLPETTFEAAVEISHKVAAAIDVAMAAFPPVSASIGVGWFESAAAGFPAMVDAADRLMYEVKREGKHDVLVRRICLPGVDSAGLTQR